MKEHKNKFTCSLNWHALLIQIFFESFYLLNVHVGSIIVEVFPREKEVVPEELGGQQASSAAETNFSFEQDKPDAYSTY
jgi:hypothetical protein